ncbi:hypothetical protein V1517DRAFT_374798 [Lipomyces orientalis]|uniref:Uncharacterized protein n=1 Tax=Lipomyces orientalis TaxID=1233043 RepID=A0ACC3TKG2_9ASCO
MPAFDVFRELKSRLAFVAALASIGSMGFGFYNGSGGALGISEFKTAFGKPNPVTGAYALPSSYTSAGTDLGSTGIILGGLIEFAPYCARSLGRRASFLRTSDIALHRNHHPSHHHRFILAVGSSAKLSHVQEFGWLQILFHFI